MSCIWCNNDVFLIKFFGMFQETQSMYVIFSALIKSTYLGINHIKEIDQEIIDYFLSFYCTAIP